MVKYLSSAFALVALVAAPKPARGGEARVPGGLSPDGKLELVAIEKKSSVDMPTNHEFVLRETESKKKQLKVSEAGYAETIYAAIDSEYAVNSGVLWNADSNGFAFNLRDTKRSRSTSVFALKNGKWKSILIKNPFPQISKDLGIKEVNHCAFDDPLRWEGKETLILKSSGDCVLPNIPRQEAFRWFEYEVKYDLANLDRCEIKRILLRDNAG